MLKRIYVDNYKSLVNFELNLPKLALLLGENGTGKSAILDLLGAVRSLVVEEASVASLFHRRSLTRWQHRTEQKIELEVEGSGGVFSYELTLGYDKDAEHPRLLSETVSFDRRTIFHSNVGGGTLYRDDFNPGQQVVVGESRSGLAWLKPSQQNRKLQWFVGWLRRLTVVRPDPRAAGSRSEREARWPSADASNFASWYRHLRLSKTSVEKQLRDDLVHCIAGFEELLLDEVSESTYRLKAQLRVGEANARTSFPFDFEELSEGQRNLVILYALLRASAASEEASTLVIDEPDNFVALAEIQPWLTAVLDATKETSLQCLIASHHPEAIDYLATESGILLTRSDAGPTRQKPYRFDEASVLSASERIARGLDREP